MLLGARGAGYKLVVTLLAREADASDVFNEIGRYWSSLDDVTGDHVMFVLGATGPGRRFPDTGISEKRAPVWHFSPNAAILGRRPIYLYGPVRKRQFGDERPDEVSADQLAKWHSTEITDLRRTIGLDEKSIPAILFFLLDDAAGLKESPKPLISPLSALGDHSIYTYVKELVTALDPAFVAIDQANSNLTKLQSDLHRIEKKLGLTGFLTRSVGEYDLRMLGQCRKAAAEILGICRSATSSLEHKRLCFDRLRDVRKEIGSHSDLFTRLQSHIDQSFFKQSVQWRAREKLREDFLGEIKGATARQLETWKGVRPVVKSFIAMSGPRAVPQWDFFIAYSSKDAHYAELLYSELSKYGLVG
jgi:hypothetical protein